MVDDVVGIVGNCVIVGCFVVKVVECCVVGVVVRN